MCSGHRARVSIAIISSTLLCSWSCDSAQAPSVTVSQKASTEFTPFPELVYYGANYDAIIAGLKERGITFTERNLGGMGNIRIKYRYGNQDWWTEVAREDGVYAFNKGPFTELKAEDFERYNEWIKLHQEPK
jgi:hypothetical protein